MIIILDKEKHIYSSLPKWLLKAFLKYFIYFFKDAFDNINMYGYIFCRT